MKHARTHARTRGDGEERGERAGGGELPAEEEPVAERDGQGRAGAEDDDGLDVGVRERAHVAVHAEDEGDGVDKVGLSGCLGVESVAWMHAWDTLVCQTDPACVSEFVRRRRVAP